MEDHVQLHQRFSHDFVHWNSTNNWPMFQLQSNFHFNSFSFYKKKIQSKLTKTSSVGRTIRTFALYRSFKYLTTIKNTIDIQLRLVVIQFISVKINSINLITNLGNLNRVASFDGLRTPNKLGNWLLNTWIAAPVVNPLTNGSLK